MKVIQGDCLDVLPTLAEGSVQTCVTSPPYWGLRDYGVEGQLGLERTPEEYVSRMVEVFREVRRVLREDGTLWLNLGDSYANTGGADRRMSMKSTIGRSHGGTGDVLHHAASASLPIPSKDMPPGLKPKDLVGIPWRVAFALQADGWWLRSDIIWSKPNPMPESVTDRPTKAHEYLFLLSKSERYYYDAEAVKESAEYGFSKSTGNDWRQGMGTAERNPERGKRTVTPGTGGSRNRRSVWTIATQPFPEAHFAVMPEALVEPCILAGTSPQACEKCGAPWERVVERANPGRTKVSGIGVDCDEGTAGRAGDVVAITKGWRSTCSCENTGSADCIVLDPFAGSGTVGKVAAKHGRRFIGIDLNPQYVDMARRRIAGPMFAEALA